MSSYIMYIGERVTIIYIYEYNIPGEILINNKTIFYYSLTFSYTLTVFDEISPHTGSFFDWDIDSNEIKTCGSELHG